MSVCVDLGLREGEEVPVVSDREGGFCMGSVGGGGVVVWEGWVG